MNPNKLEAYIIAASRLRDDTSEIFTYRITDGLGEIIIKAYKTLYHQVVENIKDNYLKELAIEETSDLTDRQQIALVKLYAGQLKAYLEGKLSD